MRILIVKRDKIGDMLLTTPRAGHEIARMLALAEPLGLPGLSAPAHPEFRLPGEALAFAQRWLAERRLAAGGFVVLGLGARKSRRQPSAAQVLAWSKRWRE